MNENDNKPRNRRSRAEEYLMVHSPLKKKLKFRLPRKKKKHLRTIDRKCREKFLQIAKECTDLISKIIQKRGVDLPKFSDAWKINFKKDLRETLHDTIAFKNIVENPPLYGGEIFDPKAIEDRILKVKHEMGVKIKLKGDEVVYINPTA